MALGTDWKGCFQGANIKLEFNNEFIDLVRKREKTLTYFMTFRFWGCKTWYIHVLFWGFLDTYGCYRLDRFSVVPAQYNIDVGLQNNISYRSNNSKDVAVSWFYCEDWNKKN